MFEKILGMQNYIFSTQDLLLYNIANSRGILGIAFSLFKHKNTLFKNIYQTKDQTIFKKQNTTHFLENFSNCLMRIFWENNCLLFQVRRLTYYLQRGGGGGGVVVEGWGGCGHPSPPLRVAAYLCIAQECRVYV
jgi:hypothetical protein